MTATRLVMELLDSEWTPSRAGRVLDVPKPAFFLENNNGKISLRTDDACEVKDGGDQDIEPNTWGWENERVSTKVEIDLRSADRRVGGAETDGRTRMFGYINTTGETDQYGLAPLESETAGGLVGEARRILSDHRKGLQSYDKLETTKVDDVSNTVGKNYYRAKVKIDLVVRTGQVET